MMFENSRYLQTVLYNRGGEVAVLKNRKRFNFPKSTCTEYQVMEGDSLDYIALKLLGSTRLGWAIMDANPQYRTELEIKAGDILYIPSYESVVEIVNV